MTNASPDARHTSRSSYCRDLLRQLAYPESDFTVVLSDTALLRKHKIERDQFASECGHKDQSPVAKGAKRFSFEFREPDYRDARLQVSRAFGGSAWSITVRCDADEKGAPKSKQIPDLEKYRKRALGVLNKGARKWKPKDGYCKDGKVDQPVLFSFDDIVSCIYREVFSINPQGKGLVLVTGRTGSGKSQVARGLVWRCLESMVRSGVKQGDRRPHLLTYEDPIEKDFISLDAVDDLAGGDSRIIDYTPRQRSTDCSGLKEVVKSALRQTPTALYIGEIREPDDMREAIEFAGTGHLVVATAHAGDLVESVNKILGAVSARDPASRAIVVPRILAVVHLQSVRCHNVTFGSGDARDGIDLIDGLVPALYRLTPKGAQSLVADGLFSLLPHYPSNTEAVSFGSLGRQAMAVRLCEHVARRKNPDNLPDGFTKDTWRALALANQDLDLRGSGNIQVGIPLMRDALKQDLHGE